MKSIVTPAGLKALEAAAATSQAVPGGVLRLGGSSVPPTDGGVCAYPQPTPTAPIHRPSLRVVTHPLGCTLADRAGYINLNALTPQDAQDIVAALKGKLS
jgi:hypothetical protein